MSLSPPGITEDPYWKQKDAFRILANDKDISEQVGLSRIAESVEEAQKQLDYIREVLEDLELELKTGETTMRAETKAWLKQKLDTAKADAVVREIQLLSTKLEKVKSEAGRSAKLEPTGETRSTVLPGVKGKGRRTRRKSLRRR